MRDDGLHPALHIFERLMLHGFCRYSTSANTSVVGCGGVVDWGSSKGNNSAAASFGGAIWVAIYRRAFSTSACTTGNGGILASHSKSDATPSVFWWARRYSSQTGSVT